MAQDPLRCSNAARLRGESMIGTAPEAKRWLLIEHPGPWASDHLDTPPLAGALRTAIENACFDNQARSLLIRRHGQREEARAKEWFAIDSIHGTWVSGTWSSTDDLYAAAEALGAPLVQSGSAAAPMLLVCTHGKRDACCAIRGRPIAAALKRTWPQEVWECTHLSGHRFSGTCLSLPEGVCYGGLDLQLADEVVRAQRSGTVAAAYLRGVCRWPAAAQAATGWVLEHYGPAAVTDVRPASIENVSAEVALVQVRGEAPLPDELLLEVTRTQLGPAMLSCGAAPSEHAAYRVREIREDESS